jgi:hypothetical protein
VISDLNAKLFKAILLRVIAPLRLTFLVLVCANRVELINKASPDMELFEDSDLISLLPIEAAYAIAESDSFLIRKIEDPYHTFYRLDLKTGVNLKIALKIMNTVDVKFATAGSSPVEFLTMVTDT